MNFTHAQISELLLEIANSENGTNLLMQMTLETILQVRLNNVLKE